MNRSAARVPLLLALQQLFVGLDLDVQGHLQVRQLLVITDLSSQFLPGALQRRIQLADVGPSPVLVLVTFFPDVIDVAVQTVFLRGKQWKDTKITR